MIARVAKNWRVKGLIQKALGVAPGGHWINDKLQVAFGDLKNFDRNIDTKFHDWVGIMSYLEAVNRSSVLGLAIMEIGSGWYPTLPLCFTLAGARACHTFDISRLMNESMAFRVLGILERYLDVIAEKSRRPLEAVQQTYQRLRQANTLSQLLAFAQIHYHAPADASNVPSLSAESMDLVYSNSVLEHVPAAVIGALMREAWRLLRKDGLAVHAVACNDHYAHFDKSISFINFLQFTDREWRLWNNPLNYQNRLRAPDFIRAAEESGFQVIHQARAVRPGTREALETMRLAPEFASYIGEDLAATTVDFVAIKLCSPQVSR